MSRNPPAAVARQLRRESGFGCAVCGNPIVEYHHIIEWQKSNHFDPEHMVALCPLHHAEYGKLSASKAYEAKKNPINIRTGRIYGYLGGNKNQKSLRLGGITIENCRSAINYSGIDLFSYRFHEGEYTLNTYIPNEQFWPEVLIKSNNMAASIAGFWDIEFKTNWLKFRRRAGDVFLSIDFRGDEVELDGFLIIQGNEIRLKRSATSIGGGHFSNVHMKNSACGIRIGPPGLIQPPNYAMMQPKAQYFPPSKSG